MTIQAFLKKYGTRSAPMVVRRLAGPVERSQELKDWGRVLADDLEALLETLAEGQPR